MYHPRPPRLEPKTSGGLRRTEEHTGRFWRPREGVAHGAASPSNHSVTIPCKVGRGTFLTRPALVLPETKTLLSLWRSLGQGAVPKRAQFSPLQVRALLPNIFILDLADDVEDARF